jgi:hypothetical protein
MKKPAVLASVIIVAFLTVPVVPALAEVPANVKAWAFTGDVNLRTPMSELNFPAGGTLPILTLGFSRVTLRYGGSALQGATWTDSDWTSPQPMVGSRPPPDSSQTKGSMTGAFSLYSVNLAFHSEGATPSAFVGYAGSSYDFTMPSPVLCTIGPACTPGTYYMTLNNPLTSSFSYGSLQIGVLGEAQRGAFTFSGSLAVGAVSASGYVGWGSGANRTSPTPFSGRGMAFSGEVGIGYAFSEAARVALGYQFVSFDVSGTAQFSPGGPTPWRQWGSNQGATLAFVWSW